MHVHIVCLSTWVGTQYTWWWYISFPSQTYPWSSKMVFSLVKAVISMLSQCAYISVYSKLSVSHTFLEQVDILKCDYIFMTYWKIHACIDRPLLMLKYFVSWKHYRRLAMQLLIVVLSCSLFSRIVIQDKSLLCELLVRSDCYSSLYRPKYENRADGLQYWYGHADMYHTVSMLLSLFVLGYAFKSDCQFNSREYWF